MVKRLTCIISLIVISGCSFYTPVFMPTDVPDGPPEFQAGWHDGCQSGLATGKISNAMAFRPNFGSGIYQHDPNYQSAWSSAFYTCYVTGTRAIQSGVFGLSPAD